MSFGAVLYDLDGTLVDTIGYWMEVYLQTLHDYGVDTDQKEFLELIYTLNAPFDGVLDHYGIDISKAKELRAMRDKRYTDILRTKPLWFDGAEELLHKTVEKYPTAIITGSHRSYVDAIDDQVKIESIIPTIISYDEMEGHSKPSPFGLLLAAEKLKVDPKGCVYVGDQIFDVEAANNAGMTSCLLWTEFTPSAAGEEADISAESIEDLTKLFLL